MLRSIIQGWAHNSYGFELSAAEDIASEAVIAAWHQVDSYEGRAAFTTWLIAIADNHCKKLFKQHDRELVTDFTDRPEVAETEDPGETAFNEMCVQEALNSLTPDELDIWWRKHVDGLTYKEIASITGKSEFSISSAVYRASQKMKSVLGDI